MLSLIKNIAGVYILQNIMSGGGGENAGGEKKWKLRKKEKKGKRGKEKGKMKERKRGRMIIFYTHFCDDCSVLYIILIFHYLRWMHVSSVKGKVAAGEKI